MKSLDKPSLSITGTNSNREARESQVNVDEHTEISGAQYSMTNRHSASEDKDLAKSPLRL